MFLLKYLEVKEDEKEVLNIDFIGDILREVISEISNLWYNVKIV